MLLGVEPLGIEPLGIEPLGGGAYTLTADAGTYSVSAADAGMRAARRLDRKSVV